MAASMYLSWYAKNKDEIGYLRLGEINMAAEFFVRVGNWILIFG